MNAIKKMTKRIFCFTDDQETKSKLETIIQTVQEDLKINLQLDTFYSARDLENELEIVKKSSTETILVFIDVPEPFTLVESLFKKNFFIYIILCIDSSTCSWKKIRDKIGHPNYWTLTKKPLELFEFESLISVYINSFFSSENAQQKKQKFISKKPDASLNLDANYSSLFKATLETTTNAILVINEEEKIINYNHNFLEMWRPSQSLLNNKTAKQLFEFISQQLEKPDYFLSRVEEIKKKPYSQSFDELNLIDERFIECYSNPQIADNKIIGRVWSFRDLSIRRRIEEINKLQTRAFESSTEGIVIFKDNHGEQKIIYANPAFSKIVGYDSSEIIGREINSLLNFDYSFHELMNLENPEYYNSKIETELQCIQKDGKKLFLEMHISPVQDYQKKITHYVGIVINITEHKFMLQQLSFQATHDLLTGLPNRVLLMDRIQQAIAYAKRFTLQVAIFFLDFDRFKLINDTLGHNSGDALLCEAARRLLTCVRQNDTVARIGGDEFVAVITSLKNKEDATQIAEKLLNVISKPYLIEDRELIINASIGISWFPEDGQDSHTLLKNADVALYYAKDLGGNSYQIYAKEMSAKSSERLNMENDLRKALEKNEFELFYQPIIQEKDNMVVGVEALLRWLHPKLGLLLPNSFLDIAEKTSLIIAIGEWVLRTACTQNKAWQNAGLPYFKIAVNVSYHQFEQPNFVDIVAKILEETQLKPTYLELELTESLIVKNSKETIKKMFELKEMGVNLVIDDFGTGYSSLNYLRQLPIDKIKIDRSFINEIHKNHEDYAIVLAILGMANSLKLRTVAEGIETKEQLNILSHQHMDINELQGFLFSKPVDTKTFTELLHSKNIINGKFSF